ncbi:MAG: hypothetical protein H0V66_05185 [Bdellovibrionales bacterium]|nr:hypothetical protein [Bdellovibrionales bacterium]
MKVKSLILLTCFLASSLVEAQVRPPRPNPRPLPPGHYNPRPNPYPRPAPSREFACRYADLLKYNRIIHRFMSDYECRDALRSLNRTRRFCDQQSMYNSNGQLIARYSRPSVCLRNLGYQN